jgi:hypothetical protein
MKDIWNEITREEKFRQTTNNFYNLFKYKDEGNNPYYIKVETGRDLYALRNYVLHQMDVDLKKVYLSGYFNQLEGKGNKDYSLPVYLKVSMKHIGHQHVHEGNYDNYTEWIENSVPVEFLIAPEKYPEYWV